MKRPPYQISIYRIPRTRKLHPRVELALVDEAGKGQLGFLPQGKLELSPKSRTVLQKIARGPIGDNEKDWEAFQLLIQEVFSRRVRKA